MFRTLLITSLWSLMCMPAHTEPLRIVSADFDPYTYSTPKGDGAGVMFEVVQELARRMNQSPKIEFLPWRRAQNEALSKDNIGILPLARVPERESQYIWLAHILSDPYVIFAKKNSKVDVSTLESAKHLRVGVFRGSLAESLLPKLGFDQIVPVTTDVQNVKMLKVDRIDAWVAPLSFKNRYKYKGGLGEHELRVGATLLILDEYLASSKTLPPVTVRKWQTAFQNMKEDGSYASIMKKYGFVPLR